MQAVAGDLPRLSAKEAPMPPSTPRQHIEKGGTRLARLCMAGKALQQDERSVTQLQAFALSLVLPPAFAFFQ
jgi:hypothetical protein